MEKVMDRVVETQFKIYNAICYRVWKLCFLGNRQPSLQVSIRVSGWQSYQEVFLKNGNSGAAAGKEEITIET